MPDVLGSMLLWGSLGSLLFTANLLLMKAWGVTDAARDSEGKFKRLSVKSFIGFSSMLVLMVGFPALGATATLGGDTLSFWSAWGVAYGIYFIVNLYDFVVLDYLVIVRWHPAFLRLPDTDYYTTTRPHAEGFARGTVIGLPATLASASLALAMA
jgi:hypothetical protein